MSQELNLRTMTREDVISLCETRIGDIPVTEIPKIEALFSGHSLSFLADKTIGEALDALIPEPDVPVAEEPNGDQGEAEVVNDEAN